MPAPKGHAPYNTKGEGGRPAYWTDERIEQEADALEEWMQYTKNVWYKDFALERGYLPDKFSEWAQKNERFRHVYRMAKFWQESKMVRGSLSKKYGDPMCNRILARLDTDTNWKDEDKNQTKTIDTLVEYISSLKQNLPIVDQTSKNGLPVKHETSYEDNPIDTSYILSDINVPE